MQNRSAPRRIAVLAAPRDNMRLTNPAEADMNAPKKPAETTGDVIAIASHRVADYATWRAVYDAGSDLRARSGVTGAEVFIDPRDPNAVVVVTRFDSLAAMQAFTANTELAEAMKQGGVILPRSVTIGVKP